MKKLSVLLTSIIAIAINTISYAGDMGFRFKDGKCVNDQNEEGLNPSFIGQCSDWSRTTLNRVNFSGLDLSGSSFEAADLSQSNFSKTILENVNFENSILTGARLDQSKIVKANFKRASGTNVDFSESHFTQVDFANANLSRNDFNYTKMKLSSFAYARIDLSSFEEATLTELDFTSAVIQFSRFIGTSFMASIFKESQLTEVDFVKSNFTEALFNGGRANKIKFQEVNITSSDFEYTNINSIQFLQTRFMKVGFKGDRISNATIEGSSFSDTLFSGVNLFEGMISDTTFGNSRFEDSIFVARMNLRDEERRKLAEVYQEIRILFAQEPSWISNNNTRFWLEYYKDALKNVNSSLKYIRYGEVEELNEKLKKTDLLVIPPFDSTGFTGRFYSGEYQAAIEQYLEAGGKVLFLGNALYGLREINNRNNSKYFTVPMNVTSTTAATIWMNEKLRFISSQFSKSFQSNQAQGRHVYIYPNNNNDDKKLNMKHTYLSSLNSNGYSKITGELTFGEGKILYFGYQPNPGFNRNTQIANGWRKILMYQILSAKVDLERSEDDSEETEAYPLY